MKESQAVTTTVKIYFERKIQSVKEFDQISDRERNPIDSSWFNKLNMNLFCNVMSLLIVKDTN